MVFYLLRLTIFPPSHIPREIFIANIFHSVFFILQAQAFTRLSWDEAVAPSINSFAVQHQNSQQSSPIPVDYAPYDNQREQELSQQPEAVDVFDDSHDF